MSVHFFVVVFLGEDFKKLCDRLLNILKSLCSQFVTLIEVFFGDVVADLLR